MLGPPVRIAAVVKDEAEELVGQGNPGVLFLLNLLNLIMKF